MRRAGLVTRRPDGRRLASTSSLTDQILAYGPAQWIRFTADNVTLNGSNISAAADLSPNARNVTQGTSTQQPTFADPGANFDGTDDVLVSEGGAFLNGVASMSWFFVIDLAGETLSNLNELYGVDAQNCFMNFSGGRPRVVINPGGFILPEGPTVRSGATGRFLIDARLVNGAARVWDGGAGGTNVTTAWGSGTIPCSSAPNVGAGSTSGARPFPGTIQDVIVFTTALSLADQAAVRALLAQLDGVTL